MNNPFGKSPDGFFLYFKSRYLSEENMGYILEFLLDLIIELVSTKKALILLLVLIVAVVVYNKFLG